MPSPPWPLPSHANSFQATHSLPAVGTELRKTPYVKDVPASGWVPSRPLSPHMRRAIYRRRDPHRTALMYGDISHGRESTGATRPPSRKPCSRSWWTWRHARRPEPLSSYVLRRPRPLSRTQRQTPIVQGNPSSTRRRSIESWHRTNRYPLIRDEFP